MLAILAVVFASAVPTLVGQAPGRPAVFTAEQAAAGLVELKRNTFGPCTDCHTTSLTGREGDVAELPPIGSLPGEYQNLINGNGGKVPALVGPTFVMRWAARSTRNLSTEFLERFGPRTGHLSEETRLDLIAYILKANGALPGAQPLTMTTDVEIRSILPDGRVKSNR